MLVGRWSDLAPGRQEIRGLNSLMDFREPQYRREVFLRFYEFHLKYGTSPGCVYFLIPYLFDGAPMEDKLWFAQLNGLTQNPLTSKIIYEEWPEVPRTDLELQVMDDWFNTNWAQLPFDTDRRYQKREFPLAIRAYSKALAGGSQEAFFNSLMDGAQTAEERFDRLWRAVQSQFHSFGRLSTWSYLEYLFICGLDLEPSSMMLRDLSGSKSHRNGLSIVLGRDDLDWRKDSEFQGRYRPEVMSWLEQEADNLLAEAQSRAEDQPWRRSVSRFTLESALCTYKGWYRPNRRYPNVYSDMLHDRIVQAETLWPHRDLKVFWEARERCLPQHLRMEDCPDDPGLQRIKQNHFRLTGEVVMMQVDWPVFRNDGSWRIGR